jgi:signal transduction histidine kinase
MSHELRTPLNAIIGFAELMHNGKVPAADHHEYLGDILDLAKVESDRMDFRPQKVQLPKGVGEAKDILRSLAAKQRIQIDVAIDPGTQEAFLDPGKFKQVLYNCLSNAIKFSKEGGRVRLCIGPENLHRFRLEVEDEDVVRTLARTVLSKAGYALLEARRGKRPS